ncbi:glycosyltransferase family 2 protein [Candidatus Berkelbacteria bacterium]|nr:glycosyltransferase family 2 protein [Candidatus Berkelbacteria bacterium]
MPRRHPQPLPRRQAGSTLNPQQGGSASRPVPTVAIVLPAYNEEAVIESSVTRLLALLDRFVRDQVMTRGSFLCFVDDGSRDRTWSLIQSSHDRDSRVRGIKLARNVGHQHAVLAGLLSVRDRVDCAISLDVDLQQDPAAIPEFVAQYRAGADIVFGVRQDRGADRLFKKWTALAFYRLMSFLGVRVIPNHADYRLTSQAVLQALAEYEEVNLFLRGIFSQMGFPTAVVHFTVTERRAGSSKYSPLKMVSFAWEGITSFSVVPLRLVTVTGFLVFFLSLGMSLFILASSLVGNNTVPGWASTTLPIYFLGGVQILCVGLLGEYIGKIYREVKRRPRFIIEQEVGHEKG